MSSKKKEAISSLLSFSLLLIRALVVRTVLRALWAGLRAIRILMSLLGTGLSGAVHVLRSGVPSLREFLGVAVDVRDVLILDRRRAHSYPR